MRGSSQLIRGERNFGTSHARVTSLILHGHCFVYPQYRSFPFLLYLKRMSVDLEDFTPEFFNPVTYPNQVLLVSNPNTYSPVPHPYSTASNPLPKMPTRTSAQLCPFSCVRQDVLQSIWIPSPTTPAPSNPKFLESKLTGLQLEGRAMSALSLLDVVHERAQKTLNFFKGPRAMDKTSRRDNTLSNRVRGI